MISVRWGLLASLALVGWARTSVTPLAGNTYEITVSAAPACGVIGAAELASRDAAIATRRSGFDGYMILGGQAQNNIGVIDYTPVTANTYGSDA